MESKFNIERANMLAREDRNEKIKSSAKNISYGAVKGVNKFSEKVSKGVSSKIASKGMKRVKSKRILRKGKRMVVRIKEQQPAEYIPIYFKQEVEEARKSLFF